MTRRPSRRRGRRGTPPPPGAEPTEQPAQTEAPRAGFGRAALILALLLGALIERAALRLPTEALDIFHFVVLAGIALLATLAYRGFARRAIERSRERKRNR